MASVEETHHETEWYTLLAFHPEEAPVPTAIIHIAGPLGAAIAKLVPIVLFDANPSNTALISRAAISSLRTGSSPCRGTVMPPGRVPNERRFRFRLSPCFLSVRMRGRRCPRCFPME